MLAACSAIGDSSPGFRDTCRFPFHAADAASASSLEQHSISCLLPENGWVTYPSDFSRTPLAGESRISLTWSSPRFLCRCTGSFETSCGSCCSGLLSLSSAPDFSPATRPSPAKFSREKSAPPRWASATTSGAASRPLLRSLWARLQRDLDLARHFFCSPQLSWWPLSWRCCSRKRGGAGLSDQAIATRDRDLARPARSVNFKPKNDACASVFWNSTSSAY